MYSRRDFIRKQAYAGLALAAMPDMLQGAELSKQEIQLISPIDGDMMHQLDVKIIDGQKVIPVKIAAPSNSLLNVNGIGAKKTDGLFIANIPLNQYRNELTIADQKTGFKKTVTIFWLESLANKYRLSIDDAIWFLKDINQHADTYKSLFDNPFLGFLKQIHDQYQTKVHINIFYETDGFNLSQMTDQFRSEWKNNADWLRLSFHAKAELPDDPYKFATYEQVKKECGAVIEQIKRFAGVESTTPVTTLHWGEVPVEVSRALRDLGYKGQLCDFNVDDNLSPCSYYLTVDQRRHINKRFVWADNQEDIIFIKSSIIIDTVKLPGIKPHLDQYEKQSRKPPYVDLLVHEQYFYPAYHAYQPDYREKVLTAVSWADSNGYKPAFLHECIFA